MKEVTKKALVSAAGILMTISLVGCGANPKSQSTETAPDAAATVESGSTDVPPEAASKLHLKGGDAFPNFEATNISNDETVSNEVFKKNKVTVLSFWFNGCTSCVKEMPLLQELSDKYKDKGVNVLGVNAEAGFTDDAKDEGRDILSKQGVTYDNIAFNSKSDANQVIEGLTAFPTTMVIDQDGKLVGDPITGGLDRLEGSELLKRVDEALAKAKDN
ncbi:TlpA disulfide reductase family protein [Olsenella sp. Marseille-P4559]|uniref:TlpA family protein disulfide reductase n=1 Tax=Olsenella sp. Marseille-P4559 TaxID=2364795 RepID=UPI001030AA7F|nr:TlpA disulfide reductase family protein [Olsenella sp. Marseille-P4559]